MGDLANHDFAVRRSVKAFAGWKSQTTDTTQPPHDEDRGWKEAFQTFKTLKVVSYVSAVKFVFANRLDHSRFFPKGQLPSFRSKCWWPLTWSAVDLAHTNI